jgi:hypothetical protein
MSTSLPGGGVSAPDAGEARTYRQHVLAGRRPIQIGLLLEVASLIVGAVVLRQLTGPGPDRLARTIVGLVIWIGPLAAIAVTMKLGPRGRFRDWWWPRVIVRVDDHGLAWWTEGSVHRPEDVLAWSSVAAVGPTLPSRSRPPGGDCALSGADGQIVGRLPCRLVRIDRPASRPWRRVVWLPDVAVAVRPDRFQRRRLLGRRATLRDPAAEPTA